MPRASSDTRELDHARLLADLHREPVNALGSAVEKFAYLRGVLDAQVMMEADMKSGEACCPFPHLLTSNTLQGGTLLLNTLSALSAAFLRSALNKDSLA